MQVFAREELMREKKAKERRRRMKFVLFLFSQRGSLANKIKAANIKVGTAKGILKRLTKSEGSTMDEIISFRESVQKY